MDFMATIRDYIDLVEAGRFPAGNPAMADQSGVEKWTRETLDNAGITAKVMHGSVFVGSMPDKQRADDALKANAALRRPLRVQVDPTMAA
jgi:hypothetical protein